LVIEHILINCVWTHQWYDAFVEWIEIDTKLLAIPWNGKP
jgi:hypothetical protein